MDARKGIIGLVLTAGLTSLMASSAWAQEAWQKIAVPAEKYTVQVNGAQRDIYPGCALPGSEYAFYFKPGIEDKLVVFFNGGGACWNSTTCLTSLQSPLPAYVPSVNAPGNAPQNLKGVFNLDNPDNPFRDWSILFLPYCTGDVHIGSKDTSYIPDFGAGPAVTIHHRGFDNFLYSGNWLQQHYPQLNPDKVVVAGVSAGAYGATLNYPYVRAAFPESKSYLLADAGVGVLTTDFIRAAINGPNSSWGAQANLAPWVPGFSILPNMGGDSFMVLAYSLLTSHYPLDKFSEFTTAWDAVQPVFYNIMLHPTDIQQWPNLTPSLLTTWAIKARLFTALETSASNFRFNIMPGCIHTILKSDRFYSVVNQGVPFTAWINAAITGRGPSTAADWKNLSCNARMDCPPPPPADMAACLQASVPR